jgi:hypothetical protein
LSVTIHSTNRNVITDISVADLFTLPAVERSTHRHLDAVQMAPAEGPPRTRTG